MGTSEHILVVDDDPDIRELVKEYFQEEGFRISLASDGQGMWQVFHKGHVDLVLLDVRLPGEDGLTLAADIRRKSSAGIIMLSRKTELVDRVAGLEVGADDYVPKPFQLRELLARVRSVLRRRKATPSDNQIHEPNEKLSFAGFELDRHKRVLLDDKQEPVKLSPSEFDLLLAFLEHPRRALSRDEILDFAYGREATPFDRSIDVKVVRLRRKIEVNPQQPEIIKTVHGIGYIFDMDVGRA